MDDLTRELRQLAMAAARMGIWTWDAVRDVHSRDATLNQILGLPAKETTHPLADFLSHVHPDDRDRVHAEFVRCAQQQVALSTEFRVVLSDGNVRWVRDQGGNLRQRNSDGPFLAGACTDITDRKEVGEALRSSEERLRLMVESATDYAIFNVDHERRITTWNIGAEKIFRYTGEDIIGRQTDILFTPEDRATMQPQIEHDTAMRTGRASDERWHLRKDGSRFYASGVLVRLGQAGERGFAKVARDLTDRKRAEDALHEARDRLEARVSERTAALAAANEALTAEMTARTELRVRLTRAQEEERLRISRELHDGVGQLITALLLRLKTIENRVPTDATDGIAELRRITDEIAKEVHYVALQLRPTSLDDVGLNAALGAHVASWSERTGIKADFHAMEFERVRPDVATALYRVAQEALNNVAKHSQATEVGVILEARDNQITLIVEDNGRGFALEQSEQEAQAAGRLGLLGMRERLAALDGVLEIELNGASGTTLYAKIPK